MKGLVSAFVVVVAVSLPSYGQGRQMDLPSEVADIVNRVYGPQLSDQQIKDIIDSVNNVFNTDIRSEGDWLFAIRLQSIRLFEKYQRIAMINFYLEVFDFVRAHQRDIGALAQLKKTGVKTKDLGYAITNFKYSISLREIGTQANGRFGSRPTAMAIMAGAAMELIEKAGNYDFGINYSKFFASRGIDSRLQTSPLFNCQSVFAK